MAKTNPIVDSLISYQPTVKALMIGENEKLGPGVLQRLGSVMNAQHKEVLQDSLRTSGDTYHFCSYRRMLNVVRMLGAVPIYEEDYKEEIVGREGHYAVFHIPTLNGLLVTDSLLSSDGQLHVIQSDLVFNFSTPWPTVGNAIKVWAKGLHFDYVGNRLALVIDATSGLVYKYKLFVGGGNSYKKWTVQPKDYYLLNTREQMTLLWDSQGGKEYDKLQAEAQKTHQTKLTKVNNRLGVIDPYLQILL